MKKRILFGLAGLVILTAAAIVTVNNGNVKKSLVTCEGVLAIRL